jgi:transcriptional regulator
MGPTANNLLQGTLDLLILKTLSWGPAHGYAIARWTQQLTGDALKLGQGSLYPALYRLEEKGLIDAKWSESPNGRRTKVYSVTASGRKYLTEQRENWERFSGALAAILRVT